MLFIDHGQAEPLKFHTFLYQGMCADDHIHVATSECRQCPFSLGCLCAADEQLDSIAALSKERSCISKMLFGQYLGRGH